MFETKFKIGDIVWFLDINEECYAKKELVIIVAQCIVGGIEIHIEEHETITTYRLMKVSDLAKEVENNCYYEEQYLAKSKEEVQGFINRISNHFVQELV